LIFLTARNQSAASATTDYGHIVLLNFYRLVFCFLVSNLNQQNRSSQYSRTIGGILDGMNEGEFVFGNNRKQPSYRNGIVVQKKDADNESAYVFACNLNTGNI